MTIKKFITAFIICALILVAAVAMIRADIYTRTLSGNHERSIFSYEKINYSQGRLELFGIVYNLDLNLVGEIKEKFHDIYAHNLKHIPDFVLNIGKMFGDVVGKLIDNPLQN